MFTLIKVQPGGHGLLHAYQITQIINGTRTVADVLAKSGREALNTFATSRGQSLRSRLSQVRA